MKTDLKSPYTGGEVEIFTRMETITYKGKEVEVELTSYRCVDTGNLYGTGEMTDKNTDAILAAHKKKVNEDISKWLRTYDGHEQRMLERMKRFNRKPKAKKARRFHMDYTNKAAKVIFSTYRNSRIN